MLNPQAGGPGFFCRGALPLATVSCYLKHRILALYRCRLAAVGLHYQG